MLIAHSSDSQILCGKYIRYSGQSHNFFERGVTISGEKEYPSEWAFYRIRSARRWFTYLSSVYEPVVTTAFWPQSLQREILDVIDIDREDHVLDVGCGTGVTTELLGRRAGVVDVLDLSSPQLRRARRKQYDVPTRFARGDAEYLPYVNDTFDITVSVGAIPYFPNPTIV